MKNKHGFTLIEILVVTALIGILLSLAVPPLASIVARYQFKADVQQVYSDLLLARANSTLLNKPYSFIQDVAGYKIEDSDHNILAERSYLNAVVSSSPVQFSFHPAGRLDPLLPVEIDISGSGTGEVYTIKISTIGHIRVERGSI